MSGQEIRMSLLEPFQLRILSFSGQEIVITTTLSSTLRDLKSEVCAVKGLPSFRVQLVLGTQPLLIEDGQLWTFGISSLGCHLDLVVTRPDDAAFDRLHELSGAGWISLLEGHLAFKPGDYLAALSETQKNEVFETIVADERVWKLTITQASLSDEDAGRLAHAVEKSTVLQVVNLSYNRIGSEGVSKLAAAFERNYCLRELYLFDNPIEQQGIDRLQESKAVLGQQHGRQPTMLLW